MKAPRTLTQTKRQLSESKRENKTPPRRIPHLELFQREESPSSHTVRTRLSMLGVDYIVHTIVPVSSKSAEIPLLIDRKTGSRLHGTKAILSYLEKQYGQPKATRLENWIVQITSRIRRRADELAWSFRNPAVGARQLKPVRIAESVTTRKKIRKSA